MTNNEYSYETYTLENDGTIDYCVTECLEPSDTWGEEYGTLTDINYWQPNYFEKIKTILDCPTFDKSLPINTFVKIYDIEESLVKYLINNVVYYNNKFKINLNKNTITFGSISLSNLPIDETYQYYLEDYLDTIKFDKEDIELICLNVINSNNLDLFKMIESKYDIALLFSKSVSIIHKRLIKFNIINQSFMCSNSITHHILDKYDVNVYYYLLHHIDLHIHFNKLNYILQCKIINSIQNNTIYEIKTLIDKSLKNNDSYNDLIELLVFKTNKIEIYEHYIYNCIEYHKYNLMRRLIYNRPLILPYLNYYNIFQRLIDIFNDKIHISYGSNEIKDTHVLKLWNLLFPHIEKSDINLEYYFSCNNVLHSLVGFRKSLTIIKDIQPYIIDWNKEDYMDFIPLLDCIRYSSYNSVKYMIENLDIDLYHHTSVFNILICAIYNSDVRVIKYIGTLIKNNIILTNTFKIGQQHIPDYIIALNKSKNKVFNKFKIKLNIIIDIFGIQIIDDIFNNFSCNKYVVKHLITKFNYSPTFKTLYIKKVHNTYTDDLKLIIDNTDFNSTLFKYNHFIIFIVYYSIKDIGMAIEAFEYAFRHYNITKTPVENSDLEYLIYNIYNPSTHTTELFEKYILYLRETIIINDTLDFTILWHGYNLDKFNTILDILFKNGFYFMNKYWNYDNYNKLNNLYHYQILYHINNKYNHTNIDKWCIVIYTLKLFVRNRFKKIKKQFTYKLKDVNHEFKFKPCLHFNLSSIHKTKTFNPYHIKPIDCLKSLNETHNKITIKADGIHKTGCFNVYPDVIKQSLLDLSYIEYECVKKDNICYFFNYLVDSTDIYDVILKLREIHPFIPNKIYPRLNLSNYKEVFIDYDRTELEALNKFKKQFKHKKKWWAKYIFKFEHMSHNDYINLLHDIKQLEMKSIPTDGWILIDNNYNDLIKIKLDNHLTIDLLWKNKSLYDNQGNSYNISVVNNKSLLDDNIYRCYYDDINNSWKPIEIRYDKQRPNDVSIIKPILLSHLYKWNINDLTKLKLYYQKYNVCRYQSYKLSKSILRYNDYINADSVLDLGCGFNNFKKIKTYVGLDYDPKVSVNNTTEKNKYICDLTLDWEEKEQLKTYSNSYYHFPNIMDFNYKYHSTKFDTILSINSIHYLLEGNHKTLFNNINRHTHTNSKIIVKCLDGFLTKSLLIKNKYISSGSCFIRRENKNQIKIYYDWCHNTPRIETLYEKEEIMDIFNKYGWGLKHYNCESINDNLTDWEKYFKCFSVYVFTRFS